MGIHKWDFRCSVEPDRSESLRGQRVGSFGRFRYAVSLVVVREWWPLLTVETEANGNSRITNERGSSLVG
jgi:hypothetical protein